MPGGTSSIKGQFNAKNDNTNPHANFTSTINGITWKAEAFSKTSNSDTLVNIDLANESNAANKLANSETTQVTITGTVATAGQALKYKHTNNGDIANVNFAGDTNSQALPSNVTTIKITLKKAGSK